MRGSVSCGDASAVATVQQEARRTNRDVNSSSNVRVSCSDTRSTASCSDDIVSYSDDNPSSECETVKMIYTDLVRERIRMKTYHVSKAWPAPSWLGA